MVGIRTTLYAQNRLFINAALSLLIVKLIGKLLATCAETAAGWRIRGTRKITLQDNSTPCSLFPRIR